MSPLLYVVVCDVCGTRTEHDKSPTLITPFYGRDRSLCEACIENIDAAHQELDQDMMGVLKRMAREQGRLT